MRMAAQPAMMAVALTGGAWSFGQQHLQSLMITSARRWIQYLAVDSLADYLMKAGNGPAFEDNTEAADQTDQIVTEKALLMQQATDYKIDLLLVLCFLYGMSLIVLLTMAFMWQRSRPLRNSLRESCEMFVKKAPTQYP